MFNSVTTDRLPYPHFLLCFILFPIPFLPCYIICCFKFFLGTSLVAQWLRIHLLGFPGGAVVESLPANAEDTGSRPGLGGSHMPWSN